MARVTLKKKPKDWDTRKKNIVKGAREPRYRDSKSVRGSQDHQAFQIKGGAKKGGTIVKVQTHN